MEKTKAALLVALGLAVGWGLQGRAEAEEPRAAIYRCGSFEVPGNSWNRGKERWMSVSSNGILMEAGEAAFPLPAGWVPVGGNGQGAKGTVIACMQR